MEARIRNVVKRLAKSEVGANVFPVTEPKRASGCPRGEVFGKALSRRWSRDEKWANFFIWIRCNPLKSPDSAKGIQGNPSDFPWIYLV
jgi:hypothetical protein